VSTSVPWVDLARRAELQTVRGAISRVLESGRFIGGEEVERLETSVAGWMGRSFGVAVSSGTSALELALTALDVGTGDEVIVPAVSFVATAGAVVRVGATPVVVDIGVEGPWMDHAAAHAAVTSRTRAVIPVHLFGTACPELGLDLPVIDDACQAVSPGGPSKGVMTALSFYPTKVLGGIGEGGMILTDDSILSDRLGALRNHGMDQSGRSVEARGTNARLNSIQAAAIRVQMDTMNEEFTRRKEIASALDTVIGEHAVRRDAMGPVSIYALQISDRDALADTLRLAGIATQVYYSLPVHAHPAIAAHCRTPEPTPNAELFCKEALALPCHGGISDEQLQYMVETLHKALQ
jgi:UDP-2-acetamido-2-deoxy-ribo-hexuluronate aminotransferase